MDDALMEAGFAFDLLLAALIVWLGWLALNSESLFRAVVLFVSFGLFMGLAWVRLDAPDVALAEVAVSAGLTGALLLAAFGGRAVRETTMKRAAVKLRPRLVRALLTLTLAFVFAGLVAATFSLPSDPTSLEEAVSAELARTGAPNPVTAVLLDFRGYDTLLELGVLILALIATWKMRGGELQAQRDPGEILWFLSGVQVPVMIVVAGYLLWSGGRAPGGAFQAGAVLATAGVLLVLSGSDWPRRLSGWAFRVGVVLGLAVFLVTGLASVLGGRAFLDHSEAHGPSIILLLEVGATGSIALALLDMFVSVLRGDAGGPARASTMEEP